MFSERIVDLFVVALLLISCFIPQPLCAEEFLAEFESPEPSWKVLTQAQETLVSIHERRRGTGQTGGAEFVRLQATKENSRVRLLHAVPPATVLDELEIAIWVKSNREGFELNAIVVLPDVLDPETRAPLTLTIIGDRYASIDQWQQLKCRTTDKSISDRLRMLRDRQIRANKPVAINPKEMYVQKIYIEGHLPPGNTDVFFDNLSVSSLVRYEVDADQVAETPEPAQPIRQTYAQTGPVETRDPAKIEFRNHKLFADQKPMFVRMVSDRGERPLAIASSGANVVWIRNHENLGAIESLRKEGLMITATPPFAKGIDGEPLDSDDANLLPLADSTKNISFFMLGARMTLEGRPKLTSWTNQVRNADRKWRHPIAADVAENERLCSRHLDMLGMSRHIMHSECSLSEYRDWIIQRRDRAWPDTFCFTWIQTEPAPQFSNLASRSDYTPLLEPEQLRLQVYAALAAGCRGIGYWSESPLDANNPVARERLLAITQLNMELDLFEPWIASGGTPQLVSFRVDAARADVQKPLVKTQRTKNAPAPAKAPRMLPKELKAVLIRAEQGALLLPMWLDENAQYVPGQMVASNISIVVPGGGETASAWEITTTGALRNLLREPTAGGVQIKLPRLDQTAAILITSNPDQIEELNQKIVSIREHSARTIVELAKLKLERTRQVDRALQGYGVGRPNAPQLLGEAKIELDIAESALSRAEYFDARNAAERAMQLGRILQRSHWDYAVRRLPNLTASPWSLCFQTLPEHWRLTRQFEQFGSLDRLDNLLPSGEFEDRGTLQAEHWKWEHLPQDQVRSSAELFNVAKQGQSSLRLSASSNPGEPPPKLITKPLMSIVTPGVSVHAGHYVYISGLAKITSPLTGSIDGALVYDSIMGKPGAVRLKGAQDWKKFELIRPVTESQELTVSILMQGVGELLIDDLRISEIEFDSSNKPRAISPATYATDPKDAQKRPARK